MSGMTMVSFCGSRSTTRDERSTKRHTVSLPAHFYVWLASREAVFLKGKYVWVNFDVDEMKERADEIEKSRLLTVLLDGHRV